MLNSKTYTTDEIRDLVVGLFREILGNRNITAEDDFFEHGGDSVKGVTLVHSLRDKVGVRVPIATLFMRRTPDELCDEVMASLAG
ncbi:MAG TPA: acyl carrier protein [Pseudonocardiaceae bacterium]|nr:acyl carrier protein [Pseudonocardiaceae bacterium]